MAHPNVLTSAEPLDRRFPDPRALGHVMDADASQTQVIAAARDGQDLVVQGPPGTGKSQTITNIVAVAAKEGKRVLFVAEKRAALDVVHERLKGCGLGPLCLELHSSGANKQNVYGDLARTLSLGSPAPIDDSVFTHLREVRDDLNRMSDLLHDADETTAATPYGIIGDLSYWSDGADPPDFAIPECDRWSLDEWKERIRATDALATLTGEYGPEASHPWRGATRRLTEMDQRRLAGHLVTAAERLTSLEAALLQAAVAAGLIARRADGLPSAWTPSHAGWVAKHLEALDTIPEAVPQVLCVAELGDGSAKRLAAASQLARDIADVQALRAEALAVVDVVALSADWTDVVLALRASGRSMFRWLSGDYRRATRRLRSVMVGELPKDVAGRLSVAERLAHGVGDLRARKEAVASREELGRALFDSHWRQSETDVGSVWRALRWLTDQTALLEAHPAPAGSAMDRSTATVSLSDVARQIETYRTYRRATDQDPAAALRRAADEWTGAWQVVAADVGLHAQTAFSAEVDCVALADLRERLTVWTGHLGRIEDVSRSVVAHYVARIVATEGPVSIAEVVRRLTRLWGCARTGFRIRGAIERAVTAAVRAGTVRYSAGHGFLDRPDATQPPQVRDRSEMPAAARQVDRLPPTEVQQAIRQTVEQSVSVSVEQCVVEVARMMGYRRTPSGFHDLVASEARQLVASGALVEKGGELRIGQRHAASETP